MKFKRKIVILLLLAALSALALYYLPEHGSLIPGYDKYIFYPFQSVRGALFDILPFSLGDIIYLSGGVWLLVTVVKWIKYIIKFGSYKELLGLSILNAINTILFVYLFFILGWGANYYKQPLSEYWGLHNNGSDPVKLSKSELKLKTKNDLIAFDSFLVSKLNIYAPHCRSLSLKEINERTRAYYSQYTDSKVAKYGLGIKPSMFGYFMERLALEGYYNPFTGEGQVDNGLPSFIMPFLVSHELAHQAGIAAEDDANLVAYALGTTTDDSTFRYSSYLNIWTYTNNRLHWRDSISAKKFESLLNKLTVAHLDTLEQINRKYENLFATYTGDLYDSYLKMHAQKEGIRSYSNVTTSAWQLEQERVTGESKIISIP